MTAKQHALGVCLMIGIFAAGAIVGIQYSEKKSYFVRAAPVPTITLEGADTVYSVGDIITLSVKKPVYPANLLKINYDWRVIDPNQPNKNIIASKDGTTINFGTGSKPTKIKVLLSTSTVFGAKDANGNIQDVDLQTTGINSFDITVK